MEKTLYIVKARLAVGGGETEEHTEKKRREREWIYILYFN